MSSIEHEGVIVEIKGNSKAVVSIVSKSACASCHAKGVCSAADQKEKKIEVTLSSDDNYSVGERVILSLESGIGLKSVLVLYVIPLIILLTLLLTLLSCKVSEPMSALISVGSVALYYVLVKIFNISLERNLYFKIRK